FHLQQILPPAYQKYVIERLKKYEKVYRLIEQEKIGQKLQQAAVFWDFDLYYEMHELLEQDWQNASGDRRRALQGLIRGVGMKIHAENNNMRAAISMGTKAQVDLQKYGRELAGFVKLDAILAEIERITAATGKRTGGNRGN
ncbi:MAG: DUF309 domain-containing protein, partial [Desulfobulbales bacterium]|nr:DUF309 domain-containing protein [Desulfobulbales bacterium]